MREIVPGVAFGAPKAPNRHRQKKKEKQPEPAQANKKKKSSPNRHMQKKHTEPAQAKIKNHSHYSKEHSIIGQYATQQHSGDPFNGALNNTTNNTILYNKA